MANQNQTHMPDHRHHNQLSVKTMLFATVAGITIGGPLLGLMAFSFLSTMALLVVTSPLLIIFSPVPIGAAFVIVAAMVGLGAAAVMAVVGLSALSWVLRSVKNDGLLKGVDVTQKLVESGEKLKGKLVESGENVMDTGKDWGSHLKQSVENSSESRTVDRGSENVNDTGKDRSVERSPANITVNRGSENVKGTGKDRGSHLKQAVENSPENKTAIRA